MITEEQVRHRHKAEDEAAKKAIDAEIRSRLEPEFKPFALTIVPDRGKDAYDVCIRARISRAEAVRLEGQS